MASHLETYANACQVTPLSLIFQEISVSRLSPVVRDVANGGLVKTGITFVHLILRDDLYDLKCMEYVMKERNDPLCCGET